MQGLSPRCYFKDFGMGESKATVAGLVAEKQYRHPTIKSLHKDVIFSMK